MCGDLGLNFHREIKQNFGNLGIESCDGLILVDWWFGK